MPGDLFDQATTALARGDERQRFRFKLALAWLALALALLCQTGILFAQDVVVKHPRSEDLVRPEGVPVRLLEAAAPSADHRIPSFISEALARISSGHRMGAIGTSDESAAPEHVFGQIDDVVLTASRVYVLDSRFNDIRSFTFTGDFVEALGRPGPGPAEFADPRALALDRQNDLLYVGDSSREVEVFSVADPDQAKHVRAFRIPDVDPIRICFRAEGLVAVNARAGRVVRAYDSTGSLLSAVGTLYGAENPTVRSTLGQTLVHCDPTRDAVIVASRDIGEIRRIDVGGSAMWIAFDPRFLLDPRVEQRGAITYAAVPEHGYRIESLIGLSVDHVIAQIAQFRTFYETTGAPPEMTSLQSFVIHLGTGEVAYVGSTLPLIQAAYGEHFVVAEDTQDTILGVYSVSR